MNKLKAAISVLCAACMMMAASAPVFAAEDPPVKLAGNGAYAYGAKALTAQTDGYQGDRDLYEHANLGKNPYPFQTTEACPYFRLWIRNYGDTSIIGTITYANTANPVQFTVPAADPSTGYSDYMTSVLKPGAGKHEIKLEAEDDGVLLHGALSVHVDSWQFAKPDDYIKHNEGFSGDYIGPVTVPSDKPYVRIAIQNTATSGTLTAKVYKIVDGKETQYDTITCVPNKWGQTGIKNLPGTDICIRVMMPEGRTPIGIVSIRTAAQEDVFR